MQMHEPLEESIDELPLKMGSQSGGRLTFRPHRSICTDHFRLSG